MLTHTKRREKKRQGCVENRKSMRGNLLMMLMIKRVRHTESYDTFEKQLISSIRSVHELCLYMQRQADEERPEKCYANIDTTKRRRRRRKTNA